MSDSHPFEIRRLGPGDLDAFDRLHDGCEDGGWCRCVAWWVPSWQGFGDRSAEANRTLRADLFARGDYDGYLAFQGGEPVGWCQVGPRDRLAKLASQYELESDPATWAITCFKVIPLCRRAGVATKLLEAVLEDLPSRGALRVEAFPRRTEDDDAMELWTGPMALFARAGFHVVHDDATRPVLAKQLAERPLVARTVGSPVGPLVLAASDVGIRMLEFPGRAGEPLPDGDSLHLDLLEAELAGYFRGELRRFTVPLDLRGTPFQVKVWRALLRIPYGVTTSYGALARSLGWPGSFRAVGGANGANRIAIVVPCHRVVRADGGLGGYGGGTPRKQWLLDLEGGQVGLPLG